MQFGSVRMREGFAGMDKTAQKIHWLAKYIAADLVKRGVGT
jgi:hypothetical protein